MGIETKKYTELHSQGAVQEQVDYIASELGLTRVQTFILHYGSAGHSLMMRHSYQRAHDLYELKKLAVKDLNATYKAVMEVEYREVYVLRCTDDH